MNLLSIRLNERSHIFKVYNVQSHLYKIQKQAKVIYGVGSKCASQEEVVIRWKYKRNFYNINNIPFLDLDAGYTRVLSL